MFTDIEGSTALIESMGDRAWMSLLHQHNRLVSDRTREHGGFLVKAEGDGYMLAFASARRALGCAAAIQRSMTRAFADHEERIRVQIGLHTGEAIREADDFFGKSVILASRIAGAAQGGQVLVSPLVRELVESSGEFVFREGPKVELKGLAGRYGLHELMWETLADVRP